jgi:hypothetical protein
VQTSLKTKSEQAPARDVVSLACYRSTRGAQIASRIDAAASLDHAQALAVGDKLRRCADLANVWHGDGLHNSDGDVYEGVGALWACNERLCPSCLASRSRKSRGRARAAIARPAMRSGYLWRFVTLTMPTLPGVSLPVAMDVIARAWRLFSGKRSASYKWWSESVSAGVKGVEFTLGDSKRLQREGREWSPETDGYHVHVHLLVLSRWIEWRRLREEWTACLKLSLAEHGIEQGINTRDGLAVCDVRLVVNKKQGSKSTITGKGAINEVAKYVTKSESWLSVPDAQLVEIASIERWPRMFELLGECREQRTPARIAADKAKRLYRERAASWRKEVDEARKHISVDARLEALQAGAEILTEKRLMVVDDELVTYDHEVVNDFDLYGKVKAELQTFGALAYGGHLCPATLAALKARTAYLDTQNLSALPKARDGTVPKRRIKKKSLRVVGREMIERGEREKWREALAVYVAELQTCRRSQQAWRYPYAEFSDLSGGRWYGLRANPASASV